jgi:hypothetical protein
MGCSKTQKANLSKKITKNHPKTQKKTPLGTESLAVGCPGYYIAASWLAI